MMSIPVVQRQEKPKGAILGAGAQGRITALVWRRSEPTRELVFLDDDRRLWNTHVHGFPVLGQMNAISTCLGTAEVIIAVGDNRVRTQLGDSLKESDVRFANVIDPSAVIMPDAVLGVGIFVGLQAVVHSGAKIGDHALINSGAIVEHDCIVAPGAAVCSGVRMGGRVIIEKNGFICTGATLAPRVVIGEKAIVGAGAVVINDIPGGCVAYGCPARVIREATEEDWAQLF
jgi:sugar O-acyltransferase (sialic acid O-acetyltransferase NeuD family)